MATLVSLMMFTDALAGGVNVSSGSNYPQADVEGHYSQPAATFELAVTSSERPSMHRLAAVVS